MPQIPPQWKSSFQTDDRSSQPNGVPTPAATGAADAARDAVAPITFEPEAVARAIVYHMVDEGLAREVTGDSVRRTVARLRRRGLRPSIRRSAWRGMSNHERLEWLLSESLTVPLMRPESDVVSLETRDDR